VAAGKSISSDELYSRIATQLRIPKSLVHGFFQELAKTAIRETRRNGAFLLPGIGRLVKAHRKAKMGSRALAGAPIKAPRRTIAKFRVNASFERRVMRMRYVKAMNFAADRSGKQTKQKASAGKFRADRRLLVENRFDSDTLLTKFREELDSTARSVWKLSGKKADADKWLPGHRSKPKKKHEVVKIFYATDRAMIAGKRLKFGSRRNTTGDLSLGSCDVSIPIDHRMGNIERPSILRLEFRENVDKHFVIHSVITKTADEFYRDLSACVDQSEKKEAFVFVHGFKVSFDDAVYRTAQISYDLQFKGAPILYSWPSNGKLYDYTPDINNNDWTTDHLEQFLRDLVSKSGARIIHLIAHSMGNRALTNALRQISLTRVNGSPECHQIVLTAPDVDADIFARLVTAIRALARRITLYVSTRDLALKASKKKNGTYPRAGDSGQRVVIVPGTDTVEASAVDTNLIGHFYYAENRSVLSDIFNLLDNKDPDKRFGIRPVKGPPPYWRFAP